jgi:hypothetical protein
VFQGIGAQVGKKKINSMTIRIPRGIFTKKTQCQERVSVIYPPRVGPIMEDRPNKPLM